MAHIHGLSIVHRDLKPENIFISSSMDGVDNVKIGDFGLATSGQFSVDKVAANSLETDGMTRSIGTAYYSAPEVRSAGNGLYSTKVDVRIFLIVVFQRIQLTLNRCIHWASSFSKCAISQWLAWKRPTLLESCDEQSRSYL